MLVWLGGKHPLENPPYDIDWTARLAGDTIVTSTWTITVTDGTTEAPTLVIQSPDGTIPAQSSTTTRTQVWLAGGTSGFTYQLRNTVTTFSGIKPLVEEVEVTMR